MLDCRYCFSVSTDYFTDGLVTVQLLGSLFLSVQSAGLSLHQNGTKNKKANKTMELTIHSSVSSGKSSFARSQTCQSRMAVSVDGSSSLR